MLWHFCFMINYQTINKLRIYKQTFSFLFSSKMQHENGG